MGSKLHLRQMGLKLLTFQGRCGCRTAFHTGDISRQIYFSPCFEKGFGDVGLGTPRLTYTFEVNNQFSYYHAESEKCCMSDSLFEKAHWCYCRCK